jgi:riboflavin synthase
MFVGVIKDTGVVEQTEPELVIKVDSDTSARIEIQSHLAINGRVFRVLSKEVNDEVSRLKFYNSNLNQANNYSPQEKVNLEPAVRLGEEIPGTFFSGIPTGIAKLVSKELLPNGNLLIKVTFENDLVNYLSVGDCVCLDGVFLQIINLDDRLISFNIYSSTLKSTNLRDKQSEFNIELEPVTIKIAKIFQKFNFK